MSVISGIQRRYLPLVRGGVGTKHKFTEKGPPYHPYFMLKWSNTYPGSIITNNYFSALAIHGRWRGICQEFSKIITGRMTQLPGSHEDCDIFCFGICDWVAKTVSQSATALLKIFERKWISQVGGEACWTVQFSLCCCAVLPWRMAGATRQWK